MRSIPITALFVIAIITSYAQPRKLRPTQVIKEQSVVKYTTDLCTIVFLKGELVNTFKYTVTTTWFKLKFPEEQQAAYRAVALLEKEGPLALRANNPRASADEKELTSLIEEKLGGAPFLIGMIEVYDKNKIRQDTIEVTTSSNYQNKYYLRNSNTPFFVVNQR